MDLALDQGRTGMAAGMLLEGRFVHDPRGAGSGSGAVAGTARSATCCRKGEPTPGLPKQSQALHRVR